MAEKHVEKKTGKIHFEFDIELPGMKDSAQDILSIVKSAADELVGIGKKVVSTTEQKSKEMKKIDIK